MNAIKKTGRIGWKGLFLAFGVLAGAACTVHAQTAADDKEVQTETTSLRSGAQPNVRSRQKGSKNCGHLTVR